jgi:predicted nucleic-acid-binding Zn-ribbon protein
MRASGDGFSATFDVNTEKFRVISCQRCKAIQLFEVKTSQTSVVLDVLFG